MAKKPWDDWEQSDGEIVGWKGRLLVVQLPDGRMVDATFPRRTGCMFGDPIGWRVRIAFRPAPRKPAFIIGRSPDGE